MTENEEPAILPGAYDYVWKVVLLGDSGVGKSSLLYRLTQNEFKENMRSGIIGDDLSTKILEVEGKTVKVRFWDTYGAKQFRSINQAFYRGAIGALLVYDITNPSTFENLESWLDELQVQDEDTVIMLLGNKCDLSDKREVPANKAELFADENNLLFMESSAVDAMYVAAAFQYLCNEIYKVVSKKEAQQSSDGEQFQDAIKHQPSKKEKITTVSDGQTIVTSNGQAVQGTAQLPKRLCCTYV